MTNVDDFLPSTGYKRLSPELQKSLLNRVMYRRYQYTKFWSRDLLPEECNILIVGDRPAPSAPADYSVFWYTPFGALRNSSLYLNLELENAGIDEHDLTWTNSTNISGESLSPAFLDPNRFPWKRIIALGGHATYWVTSAGHKCESIPHPSYWKRFHSKEPYPLIDLLK
jgi:hypothetical protein